MRVCQYILAFSCLTVAAPVHAQVYRVRATTVARGTHTPRIDGTVDAQRSIMQRFAVSANDLTGDRTQALNLHVGFRYFTDFGLVSDLRGDRSQETNWNYIPLDAAWVEYRPLSGVRLVAGRQHHWDALGMRDFDGARLSISPTFSGGLQPRFDIYGGADVQLESGRFAPNAYDVQGLPVEVEYAEAGATVAGARAGLGWRGASMDFSYARRDYDSGIGERATGEERFGMAMSGSLGASVNLSAQASYNRVLDAADTASMQLAWQLPIESVLSMGVEHRLPWFDSGSIFNIFGARPRQGAFVTYQQPVPALDSVLEGRAWARIYHGDLDHMDWGAAQEDEVAYGGALQNRTEFRSFGYPLTWRTLVSGQTSAEKSYGGDQWLADTQVAIVGLLPWRWGAAMRGVGLWSQSSTWRYGEVWNGALVGSVRLPTEVGRFEISAEFGASTEFGANSKAYLVYEVEAWP